MIIEGFGFGSIFGPIIDPVIAIAKGFLKLLELVMEILQIFPDVIAAAINIFNPTKLIDDILFGIVAGINKVMGAFIDSMDFSSADTKCHNLNKSTCKNTDGCAFKDGQCKVDESSGPFGTIDKGKPVCVPPTMINIIFLILCPPLALFLHSGIKGFFQVVVCSLLTLKAYYFPGLIYAALHILC
jgi:uncharacterized membrane protein YqaE (UPF0057 family)